MEPQPSQDQASGYLRGPGRDGITRHFQWGGRLEGAPAKEMRALAPTCQDTTAMQDKSGGGARPCGQPTGNAVAPGLRTN
eukprot:9120835-Pyramimonas_sp.AAC.1